MRQEVLDYLDCGPGSVVVDCTLGGAGHARAICDRIGSGGTFIGIDRDTDAITNARSVLANVKAVVHLFHGNFCHLTKYLTQVSIQGVDGILIDLGISLHQLEAGGRGFSFMKDEPLDMRMDVRSETTAAQLINTLHEGELKRIFIKYGEERWAGKIARRVVIERAKQPLNTSSQLARLISDTIPVRVSARQKIHPATRVFMALRIAVNHELDSLSGFLETAPGILNEGGRLCILAFHSLEDRIVKQTFKTWASPCTCPPDLPLCACGKKAQFRLLTKKVQRPSKLEIAQNPMSRSTRLRAVKKI